MNIIYFVPNITIAGGIFRIVSDKMNYLAENMEGRLFLAYYGNGQEKPIYPLHPNIQLLPIDIEWKVGFGKKINRVWKNISIIRHIFKKYKIDIADIATLLFLPFLSCSCILLKLGITNIFGKFHIFLSDSVNAITLSNFVKQHFLKY